MKKLKQLAIDFGIPALALGFPLLASAQLATSPLQPPSTITNINTLIGQNSLICTFIGWIFWFFIVLTIVFILVAAFKYLTAAGDPEKVKSASHTLLYAAIAVVVALIAKGFPLIVNSIVNGGLSGTAC